MRRNLFGNSLILLLVALLAGCGQASSPIQIGVRTANDHVPFYIADREGLYRKAGLEVKLHLVPSNTEIIEALQRGDLQVGAVPVTTAITAIDRGAHLRIVAMTGRGSDGLLVREDGGITNWADLRGKRIATIQASILDVLLRLALEGHGLDAEHDVNLIYFQQLGDMISALKTGQVDATSNTEPFMTDAVRQGWGRILGYYTEQWPDHPCCVVLAREDFCQQYPGEIDQILDAHIQAVERANQEPGFAAQVVVEYLHAFDVNLVSESLSPEKMRVDYRLTREEIARMAQLMYQQGLLQHDPATLEFVDLAPLTRILEKGR